MRISLLLIAGPAALLAGCAATHGTTASRPAAVPPRAAVSPAAAVTIGVEQAALIRAYYSSSAADAGRGRGRGRGGRSGLPPGIEKNLQRGKPLPPGLATQYLPPDLLRSLPPAPRGLEYVVVAGKLLLIEAATQVIREVLLDVLI